MSGWPRKGDRVQHRRRAGETGRVDGVRGIDVVVELDDGRTVTWQKHELARTASKPPKGATPPPTDQMRAAARLVAEGTPRREVEELYKLPKGTLAGWILQCKEHDEDRELLGQLRHG